MGMPLASDDLWTVAQVQALPDDGNKYELVWGELLVSPTPRLFHQRVVRRLRRQLEQYCEAHKVGDAWDLPGEISWSEDTLVQPDLFVISPEDAVARDWSEVKHLRLVAEVLSPRTAKHDRFQKRRLYQSQGIPAIWIIDADKRFVEVWTPDAAFPTRETERVSWHPDGATAPLVIDLRELFA